MGLQNRCAFNAKTICLENIVTKIIVTRKKCRDFEIDIHPESEIWTFPFIRESVDLVYCQDTVCYQILKECLQGQAINVCCNKLIIVLLDELY